VFYIISFSNLIIIITFSFLYTNFSSSLLSLLLNFRCNCNGMQFLNFFFRKKLLVLRKVTLFFFVALGFEFRGYTLSHSTSPFFCDGFFQDRVLQTLSLVRLRTMILLLSISCVVMIRCETSAPGKLLIFECWFCILQLLSSFINSNRPFLIGSLEFYMITRRQIISIFLYYLNASFYPSSNRCGYNFQYCAE
jgi:hypothetical protein